MDKKVDKKTAFLLSQTKPLVFVTGSFDILHLGHFRFLNQAKELVSKNGVLLVGILSDKEIQIRKGKDRPIFNLDDRIEALSYLTSVDYILPWIEPWEGLREFTTELKPKYLAVVEGDPGIENKRKHIEAIGGEFIIFSKFGGFSTSKILSQIIDEGI